MEGFRGLGFSAKTIVLRNLGVDTYVGFSGLVVSMFQAKGPKLQTLNHPNPKPETLSHHNHKP